ncbi:hypothetical protein [Enterococcus sp. AZ102]|uniref:hypothetical protein n=1 Tax=Enterococcus sp. AZ102 TaxID=2774865 RepID=UPI003F28E389
MKKSDFIKKVKALDLVGEIRSERGMLLVGGYGAVTENRAYEMSTLLNDVYLTEEQQKQLFELLTEYASTPIEERGI